MFKQIGTFNITVLVVIVLQALSSESFSIHSNNIPKAVPSVVASSKNNFKTSTIASAYQHPAAVSPLFSSSSANSDNNNNDPSSLPTYGGLVGTITGLSMTAIRQSIRTTTGISITASRTALRGLTGVSVTATLKFLVGLFPPGVRYFIQPLFIMYYTPLMILKYFIGSTKTSKDEAFASHEKITEGWKDAIRAAEQAQECWPLHVTEDGQIESLALESVAVTDAIVESLDIASNTKDQGLSKA